MEETISYKHLREIHQKEKNSPLICKIDDDFYQRLKEYFENLEDEYSSIKDKSSPKAKLLRDEIENAKRIAESIYEQREKKIVQAALVERKGGRPNIDNLTSSEKKLFESITRDLKEGYKSIFCSKNSTEREKEDKEENILVKINQDIPEFVDSDGNKYNLKKEDIVTLPKEIANALIKREVAEKGSIS